MYEHCTTEIFSFLFINLNETDPQNAFYRCFDAKLQIADAQPDGRNASMPGAELRGVSRKTGRPNSTRGANAEASRR